MSCLFQSFAAITYGEFDIKDTHIKSKISCLTLFSTHSPVASCCTNCGLLLRTVSNFESKKAILLSTRDSFLCKFVNSITFLPLLRPACNNIALTNDIKDD